MLELYLIRHANAASENAQYDHERILTETGKLESVQTGQFFKKKGITPDMFIHSDAVRTTMTAEIIARTMDYKQALITRNTLYNASIDTWLETLYSLPDTSNSIFIVGHNLGISRFASYLNGDYLPDMDTSAVYGFQFDTDSWQTIFKGSGTLISQFSPD